MKKGLLKSLLCVVILLSILIVIDLIVGQLGIKFIKWLNNTPRDSDAALLNYDLNAATPDIAILGSSTAICHYNPVIIHDSMLAFTGQENEVFNMGRSRQRIAYEYYALKSLIRRNRPKIVFVDVWASYLSEGYQINYYNEFRPYLNINSDVKEMMEQHDDYSILAKCNMFCYNTEIVKLLLSARKKTKTNGFQGDKRELNHAAVKQIEKDTCPLAQISVSEFDSLIELAKVNDIQLFVVLSPRLSPSDTTCKSYKYMLNKCCKEGIPFLDFANEKKYYQKKYFRDDTHMNFYGAELFTQDLMNEVRPFIVN